MSGLTMTEIGIALLVLAALSGLVYAAAQSGASPASAGGASGGGGKAPDSTEDRAATEEQGRG